MDIHHLVDRIDTLVDDTDGGRVDDEALVCAQVAELEEALDDLATVLDREDRLPSERESHAIAVAEQMLDRLRLD